MRVPIAFLSLPPSLLLLLATQLHAQAGGARNDEDGLQTLPTAVRKMSLDEGEKFMPEYFAFAPQDFYGGSQSPLKLQAREAGVLVLTPEEKALLAGNSSATLAFRPPFPRHRDYRGLDARSRIRGSGRGYDSQERQSNGDSWSLYRRAIEALARLQGRDFTCPSGTHVCSNINEPNYCCTDGTTCFVVENAPDAGNVGCCPDGETCGGSVAACADGNTACPAEDGGGCCIPGFRYYVLYRRSISKLNNNNNLNDNDPNTRADEFKHVNDYYYYIDDLITVHDINAHRDTDDYLNFRLRLRERHRTSTRPTHELRPNHNHREHNRDKRLLPDRVLRMRGIRRVRMLPHRARLQHYVLPAHSEHNNHHPRRNNRSATNRRPSSPHRNRNMRKCCTLSAATATATVQKELPGNAAGGWKGRREQGGVLLACVTLGWLMFSHGVIG
ncbi:hypothetical protein GQX73_g2293 [Xylaria multiplex]|uniref:Granulins domain-containing protein n=1 Tax=Xylaria multiplex TaxID=323545 RepID=A0A7C8NBF9_9PEZI|nr:hypothetical protein GQX73_g2293 [Xylaria multiplex]